MSDIRRISTLSELSSPSTEEIAVAYCNDVSEIKAIDSQRNLILFPSSGGGGSIFGNDYAFDANLANVEVTAIDPARQTIYSNVFSVSAIGFYKFNVRFQWDYASANRQAFFEWYVNGVLSGGISIEPTDVSNQDLFSDFDTLNIGVVGNVTLEIKGAKETGGGTLNANNFKSEIFRVL